MSFLLLISMFLQIDGGAPAAAAPKKPAEDTEVVKNLELLELMDETSEFELLQELSVER